MGPPPRAVTDRSPTSARSEAPAEPKLISVHVRSVLKQAQDPSASGWSWALNPYKGCQYGCTFCQVRLDTKDHDTWNSFEARIGVKVNAVEALARELRETDLDGRPIVLGTTTEPWQQAEERLRLTRALLETLARTDGLDLRIHTRSSLIARDTDLLQAISRRGRVSVTFSLASMDERVNRLMEPQAPSALRRLSAMEALARAGLNVGLVVSPVLPGLEEEEQGLEALLSRAAHAGAVFAGMKSLQLTGAQRETFLFHVDRKYPELSSRFRRVIGRRPPAAEELTALQDRFRRLCQGYGLRSVEEAHLSQRSAQAEEASAAQLSLFS